MINIFKLFGKNKKTNIPEKTAPALEWQEVEPLVRPYLRYTWVPRTDQSQADGKFSRFAGIPLLKKDEEWPLCAHCGKPLQLFLQLDSDELPAEIGAFFGSGYLQVFYCTNLKRQCEIDCEAYFPFAESTLVRILDPDKEDLAPAGFCPLPDTFPERVIVGWDKHDDYPNWEELETFGVTLSDEQYDLLAELGYPRSGDKLLGWPYWVQGIEYPSCPKCGKAMQLVFQIDSEDNLPYMFGDAGCAHVTQCAEHREVLAIAWACS